MEKKVLNLFNSYESQLIDTREFFNKVEQYFYL